MKSLEMIGKKYSVAVNGDSVLKRRIGTLSEKIVVCCGNGELVRGH